eukprot:jgi/Mesvir1/13225/Mv12753-RA.2
MARRAGARGLYAFLFLSLAWMLLEGLCADAKDNGRHLLQGSGPPTVALTSPASQATNVSPIPVTATFSEPVTGFTGAADQVTISGASIGAVTVASSSRYILSLVPSGQGVVAVSILAGVARSQAGIANLGSPPLFRTYDSLSPTLTVTLAGGLSSPTNAIPVPFTLTFTEPVEGLGLAGINVTGGSISSFAGSGTTYTVEVTPSGSGARRVAMSLRVLQGAARDAAGNLCTASSLASVIFSNTAPTVVVSTSEPAETASNSIPVTITFSEDVLANSFTGGDISISNGFVDLGSFTTLTARVFRFTLIPFGAPGLITVRVLAGVANSVAGEENVASNVLSLFYDATNPTVELATAVVSPTNQRPFSVTATFSERVTGFSTADLVTLGADITSFVSVDGATGRVYSFLVSPTRDGSVQVQVPAGSAFDGVGNPNLISNLFVIVYDTGPPTATLTSSAITPAGATPTSPITITATFNEPVTGLTLDDISVAQGGGSVSALVEVVGSAAASYTFVLAGVQEGNVVVRLAAGAVRDLAGNLMLNGAELTFSYDAGGPFVTLSTARSPTNANPVIITASFSEPVVGFTAASITAVNGNYEPNTLASVAGSNGATWTFQVRPGVDGAVRVTLSASAGITDRAGNPPSSPASLTFQYDGTRPTVELSSTQVTAGSITPLSPFNMTATFSEPVLGYGSTGSPVVVAVQASNAVVSGLAGVGAPDAAGAFQVYSFQVFPVGPGAITLAVPGGAARDVAGNLNRAGSVIFRITYDNAGVSVTLTSSAPNPTNAPFPVTATFSGPVTGFILQDIKVEGNARLSAFVGNQLATIFTFLVSPFREAEVKISVPAGNATGSNGLGNTASNVLSRVYDVTPPSVTVTALGGSPTNQNPIPLRVVFTERVTGFTVTGMTVSGPSPGSTLANLREDGTPGTYLVDLNPAPGAAGQGEYTIRVLAGAAKDLAGNDNLASSTALVVRFDDARPTVVLSTSLRDPTNLRPVDVTGTFSEEVLELAMGDLVVTGGSATRMDRLPGDGVRYQWLVTPAADDAAMQFQMDAGVCRDAAQNPNLASNVLPLRFDRIRPTTLLTDGGNDTVIVTFSEAIIGFEPLVPGDVIINGASVVSFVEAQPGTRFILSLAPPVGNRVTASVTIPQSIATDAALNGNVGSATIIVTLRPRTRPSVVLTLSTLSAPIVNVAPIAVTATFDRPVTSLTLEDLSVGGGAVNGPPSPNTVGYSDVYVFQVLPVGSPPAPNVDITVTMLDGVARDIEGFTNAASNVVIVTYDGVRPVPTITTGITSPTNRAPIPVTVTFSEEVVGFALANVGVVGGNITSGTFPSFASAFQFGVTPFAEGAVTVLVNDAVTRDVAGNLNLPAVTPLTVISDRSRPFVTITAPTLVPPGRPSNQADVLLRVAFSEPVSGFEVADLLSSNPSATFVTLTPLGGSALYDATLRYSALGVQDGATTVYMPEGRASDLAGNLNTASAPLQVAFDGFPPGVSIRCSNVTSGGFTTLRTVTITLSFTEAITGLTPSDLSISGTARAFADNLRPDSTTPSSNRYLLDVTAAAVGTVTLLFPQGAVQDPAGNGNLPSNTYTFTSDDARPTVVLSSSAGAATSTSPIPVTATFNEPVFGLQVSRFIVQGGQATQLLADATGAVYTFVLIPNGDGVALNVTVPEGICRDATGNDNTASNTLRVIYDTMLPNVTISSNAVANNGATNAQRVTITLTFNEQVTGLEPSDLAVSGTAGAVTENLRAGTFLRYFIDVLARRPGIVSLVVPPGAVTDASGVGNSVSNVYAYTFDDAPPSVTLVTPSPVSAITPITITAVFSEPVTGFTLSDIAVTGGLAVNFLPVTGGSAYTFDVFSDVEGTPVTVTVPAGVAVDVAGNGNTGSTGLTVTYDPTVPTVTLTSASVALNSSTSLARVTITATFSEAVTGLELPDLLITGSAGAVAENLRSLSTSRFLFDLRAIRGGSISVTIPASAAQDVNGRGNLASSPYFYSFDDVRPAVVLTSPFVTGASASPIPVTATFSKNVTGFSTTDISITGGQVGDFAGAQGSSVYTFGLYPTRSGLTLVVSVPEGVCQDSSRNLNSASNTLSIPYDTSVPTPVLSSASVTNNGYVSLRTVTITVTFNKPVTGLEAADLAVSGTAGAAAQNFRPQSARVYLVDLAALRVGTVNVTVPAGVAQDSANVTNVASAPFSYVFDDAPPSVTLQFAGTSAPGAVTGATNRSPLVISAVFSEPVPSFSYSATNAPSGTVASGPASSFTFSVPPSGEGRVTIQIPAGGARDLANNPSIPSNQLTIIYDTTRPTATLASPSSPVTSASPIPMTLTFSEPVEGMDLSDLILTNAAANSLAIISGGNGAFASAFSFSLSPVRVGTVSVALREFATQDAGGNANRASNELSFTFDNARPTVTLTSTVPLDGPVSSTSVLVTATFSKRVTGFSAGGVELVGGSLLGPIVERDVAAGVYVLQMAVAPPDGEKSALIREGAARDDAGNPSVVSNRLRFVFDGTPPTVVLSSAKGTVQSTLPIAITATFSEDVVGFSSALVTVAGVGGTLGTATAASSTDSRTFVFNLTPSDAGVVVLSVPATPLVTDVAQPTGNALLASPTFQLTFDPLRPSVTLTSSSNEYLNLPFTVTATFSASVTGFSINDVTVTSSDGGEPPGVSNFFIVSATLQFEFRVTPTRDGVITVNVPADVASALATGVGNTAAIPLTRTYDTVRPTVTVTPVGPSPTNVLPVPVAVTFSEPVEGFNDTDVNIAGGQGAAVANLRQISELRYEFDLVPVSNDSATYVVRVPGNAVRDRAGNYNVQAQGSVVVDTARPTVVLSLPPGSSPRNSPVNVTATFSANVTGVELDDLLVTGGIPVSVTASGTTGRVYVWLVQPQVDGLVVVRVREGAGRTAGGNPSQESNPVQFLYDGTGPSVVISAQKVFVNGIFMATVTFSEAVTGFNALMHVQVQDGFVTRAIPMNDAVTIIELDTGRDASQKTLLVSVPAAVARDAVGNPNTASNVFEVFWSTIPPTANITTTAANPTNLSPIPITVTFDKPVEGFEPGDMDLTGAVVTAGANLGTGLRFNFGITPALGDRTVTVRLRGGSVQDYFGNKNAPAGPLSILSDRTPPVPSFVIPSASSGSVSGSPVPVTVTFSEPVSGLTVGGIQVSGASVGQLGPVLNGTVASTTRFSFDLIPTSEGLVSFRLLMGAVTDAAGNPNALSPPQQFLWDSNAPTVTLTSSAPTTPLFTRATPIPVTATFSEPVLDRGLFDLSNLEITGGVAGTLGVGPGGTQFFFELFPVTPTSFTGTGPTEVRAVVPAGLAVDAAGNGNARSDPLAFLYDAYPPTVSINSTVVGPTSVSPLPITITFSEPVLGFSADVVLVTNGVVTGVTLVGGGQYLVDVVPGSQGAFVRITVPAGVVTDAANNPSLPGPVLEIAIDATVPTALLSTTATTRVNTRPIPIRATFSMPVTGFTLSDLSVTSGVATNLLPVTTSGVRANTTWSLALDPTAEGETTITIPAGSATAANGRGNSASNTLSFVYDTSPPRVDITCTLSGTNATNTSPVSCTITFSEAVDAFTPSGIVINCGNVRDFVASTDQTMFFIGIIPCQENGNVSIFVPSGVATDLAGNPSSGSVTFVFKYDTVRPTVVLTSATAVTGTSPILITATFSEPVTGFQAADILVTSPPGLTAAVSSGDFAQGRARVFVFGVSPGPGFLEGDMSIRVPAGACADDAGNLNEASSPLVVRYDTVRPTVTITTDVVTGTVVGGMVSVTVCFSEAIVSFTAADVSVANGEVISVSPPSLPPAGSYVVCYVVVVVGTADGTVTVNVPEGTVTDSAGNSNLGGGGVSFLYDGTPPTVTLAVESIGGRQYTLMLNFSEPVTGLGPGDIAASGAIVGDVTGQGARYNVTVTVLDRPGDVVVRLQLVAGAVTDAVGNSNDASAVLEFVDRAPPPPPPPPFPPPAPPPPPDGSLFLEGLELENGCLRPTFNGFTTFFYNASVMHLRSTARLRAFQGEGNVTVRINGTLAAEGAWVSVTLAYLFNPVEVTVVNGAGQSNVYMVSIYRIPPSQRGPGLPGMNNYFILRRNILQSAIVAGTAVQWTITSTQALWDTAGTCTPYTQIGLLFFRYGFSDPLLPTDPIVSNANSDLAAAQFILDNEVVGQFSLSVVEQSEGGRVGNRITYTVTHADMDMRFSTAQHRASYSQGLIALGITGRDRFGNIANTVDRIIDPGDIRVVARRRESGANAVPIIGAVSQKESGTMEALLSISGGAEVAGNYIVTVTAPALDGSGIQSLGSEFLTPAPLTDAISPFEFAVTYTPLGVNNTQIELPPVVPAGGIQFNVTTRGDDGSPLTSGGANVTLIILGPDGRPINITGVNFIIIDNHDGTYSIIIVDLPPGNYTVSVGVNGETVPVGGGSGGNGTTGGGGGGGGIPIVVTVGEISSRSRVSQLPPLSVLGPLENVTFRVKAYDAENNEIATGGDASSITLLVFTIEDFMTSAGVVVADIPGAAGSYSVSFTAPRRAGTYELLVAIDGVPLVGEQGSEPQVYVLEVRPGLLDPSMCEVISQEAYPEGGIVEILILCRDSFGNPTPYGNITITVAGDPRVFIATYLGNGLFSVILPADLVANPGQYLISISTGSGQPISTVVFRVEQAIPSLLSIYAPLPTQVYAGTPVTLSVHAVGASGRRLTSGGARQYFSLSLSGDLSGSAALGPYEVRDDGGGDYRILFQVASVAVDERSPVDSITLLLLVDGIPTAQGPAFFLARYYRGHPAYYYRLVGGAGQQLVSSTSELGDEDGVFAADGTVGQVTVEAIAGEPAPASIVRTDPGTDFLDVEFNAEDDDRLPVAIGEPNFQGTRVLTFVKTTAGKYNLTVSIGEVALPGSPLGVLVVPAAVDLASSALMPPDITPLSTTGAATSSSAGATSSATALSVTSFLSGSVILVPAGYLLRFPVRIRDRFGNEREPPPGQVQVYLRDATGGNSAPLAANVTVTPASNGSQGGAPSPASTVASITLTRAGGVRAEAYLGSELLPYAAGADGWPPAGTTPSLGYLQVVPGPVSVSHAQVLGPARDGVRAGVPTWLFVRTFDAFDNEAWDVGVRVSAVYSDVGGAREVTARAEDAATGMPITSSSSSAAASSLSSSSSAASSSLSSSSSSSGPPSGSLMATLANGTTVPAEGLNVVYRLPLTLLMAGSHDILVTVTKNASVVGAAPTTHTRTVPVVVYAGELDAAAPRTQVWVGGATSVYVAGASPVPSVAGVEDFVHVALLDAVGNRVTRLEGVLLEVALIRRPTNSSSGGGVFPRQVRRSLLAVTSVSTPAISAGNTTAELLATTGPDPNTGLFRAAFLSTVPGQYDVAIFVNGAPWGDPLPSAVTILPSPPSARVSVASGPGLLSATLGVPASFDLDVRDSFGNKVDASTVTIQNNPTGALAGASSPANEVAARVTVVRAGTLGREAVSSSIVYSATKKAFVVTYTSATVGTAEVAVRVGGAHIPGSPFNVRVLAGPTSAPSITLAGPGATGAVKGVPVAFTITARDAAGNVRTQGGDDFSVLVPGASSATVRDNGDGTYDARYVYDATSSAPSVNTLSVYMGAVLAKTQAIRLLNAGAPQAFSAARTTAAGPGLQAAIAGEATFVLVYARDELGAPLIPPVSFAATLTPVTSITTGDITASSQPLPGDGLVGTYKIPFTVTVSGTFRLRVFSADPSTLGTPIGGLWPATVTVSASNVTASGSRVTAVGSLSSGSSGVVLSRTAGSPLQLALAPGDRFGNGLPSVAALDDPGFEVVARRRVDAVGGLSPNGTLVLRTSPQQQPAGGTTVVSGVGAYLVNVNPLVAGTYDIVTYVGSGVVPVTAQGSTGSGSGATSGSVTLEVKPGLFNASTTVWRGDALATVVAGARSSLLLFPRDDYGNQLIDTSALFCSATLAQDGQPAVLGVCIQPGAACGSSSPGDSPQALQSCAIRVQYTPLRVGQHNLRVVINGRRVLDTFVTVVPGPVYASASTLQPALPSVTSLRVAQDLGVVLTPRDSEGNVAVLSDGTAAGAGVGVVTASAIQVTLTELSGQRAVISGRATPVPGSSPPRYLILGAPVRVGPWRVNITIGGAHVQGSPTTLSVGPETTSPSRVSLVGAGAFEAAAGELATFLIVARDSYNNLQGRETGDRYAITLTPFPGSVVGLSPDTPRAVLNANGTYTVSYRVYSVPVAPANASAAAAALIAPIYYMRVRLLSATDPPTALGTEIAGSPFAIRVSTGPLGPSFCQVQQPVPLGLVGQRQRYIVRMSDKWGNRWGGATSLGDARKYSNEPLRWSLQVSGPSNASVAVAYLEDRRDGTLQAVWVGMAAGQYSVFVRMDGIIIGSGRPVITVLGPGAAAPARYAVTGQGVTSTAYWEEESVLVITPQDANRNKVTDGGAMLDKVRRGLELAIRYPTGTLRGQILVAQVKDVQVSYLVDSGTYRVRYIPPQTGELRVSLSLSEELGDPVPVAGSPFRTAVQSRSVRALSCRVSGPALQGVALGQWTSLLVEVRDSGGGLVVDGLQQFDVAFLRAGSSSQLTSALFVDGEMRFRRELDGRFQMRFRVGALQTMDIYVTLVDQGLVFPGTPLRNIRVTRSYAPPSAVHSVAYGPALSAAGAGDLIGTVFRVVVLNKDGMHVPPPAEYGRSGTGYVTFVLSTVATVTEENVTVPGEVLPWESVVSYEFGEFVCRFAAQERGLYELRVYLAGEMLGGPGNVYTVNVTAGPTDGPGSELVLGGVDVRPADSINDPTPGAATMPAGATLLVTVTPRDALGNAQDFALTETWQYRVRLSAFGAGNVTSEMRLVRRNMVGSNNIATAVAIGTSGGQGPDSGYRYVASIKLTVAGLYWVTATLERSDQVAAGTSTVASTTPVAVADIGAGPLRLLVARGPMDASRCEVSGPGLRSAVVGQPAAFFLRAFDAFGNRVRSPDGLVVTSVLLPSGTQGTISSGSLSLASDTLVRGSSGNDSSLPPAILPNVTWVPAAAHFMVRYTPERDGTYEAVVMVNGGVLALGESYVNTRVTGGRVSTAASTAWGLGVRAPFALPAGTGVGFLVTARDGAGARLLTGQHKFTVVASGGCQIDGSMDTQAQAQAQGQDRLLEDSSSVSASNNVNNNNDSLDTGASSRGSVTASSSSSALAPAACPLSSPSWTARPTVMTDNGDGTYSVQYTPAGSGPYTVKISRGGQLISPVVAGPGNATVTVASGGILVPGEEGGFPMAAVAGAINITQTAVSGTGIIAGEGSEGEGEGLVVRVGQPVTLSVITRDAGGNVRVANASSEVFLFRVAVQGVLVKVSDLRLCGTCQSFLTMCSCRILTTSVGSLLLLDTGCLCRILTTSVGNLLLLDTGCLCRILTTSVGSLLLLDTGCLCRILTTSVGNLLLLDTGCLCRILTTSVGSLLLLDTGCLCRILTTSVGNLLLLDTGCLCRILTTSVGNLLLLDTGCLCRILTTSVGNLLLLDTGCLCRILTTSVGNLLLLDTGCLCRILTTSVGNLLLLDTGYLCRILTTSVGNLLLLDTGCLCRILLTRGIL